MADVDSFPISELAERTGFPRSTIHYYVRMGLLPPPRRVASNRFAYDARHEKALRLVRLLRDRRDVSLSVVRRVVPVLLTRDDAFDEATWDGLIGAEEWKAKVTPAAERLLEAATEAFAQRGFDEVNVDEICESAGVAKGSFYRHFGSKQELFFACASAAVEEIVQEFVAKLGGSVPSPEEAAPLLTDSLDRRLSLFMELLLGTLRRRREYVDVARDVMVGLGLEVGTRLNGREPLVDGARALELAVVGLFYRIFRAEAEARGEVARA